MTIRATVSPTLPTFSKKSARAMLMEAGKEMEEWRLDELWKVASATIRNDRAATATAIAKTTLTREPERAVHGYEARRI